MTPEEKAIELLEKLIPHIYNEYDGSDGGRNFNAKRHAVQCALIVVDEIILSAPFEPADTDWDEAGSSAQYWYPQKLEDSAKWWSEVKKELEKL